MWAEISAYNCENLFNMDSDRVPKMNTCRNLTSISVNNAIKVNYWHGRTS
jgi:hypothetical protein